MSIRQTTRQTLRASTIRETLLGEGGVNPLLIDLVSWWSLDETSGTRVDSHGSNDLTDNNTVTHVAGKVGNAAQFIAANSESLSSGVTSDLHGGDRDFTIGAWVYYPTAVTPSSAVLFHGTGSSATVWDYLFGFNSGGNPRFYTSSGTPEYVEWGSALSVSTWYYIMAWHDSTEGKNYISVNNMTPVSAVAITPTAKGGTTVQVGAYVSSYIDGCIDETAFWSRLLTTAERTELYNSGDGIGYPG